MEYIDGRRIDDVSDDSATTIEDKAGLMM